MSGAIEYFSNHIYLLILLAALAVFTVWSCGKAFKASAKKRKANEAIIKKLEEEATLRREFDSLTLELAASAEPERLVRGVALGLCRTIEKASDMLAEFERFNEEQKMLYSLYFVIEDGSEALSNFFKINGKPLTDYARRAVCEIYGGELAEVFAGEYLAYDEEDETTSLIPEKIAEGDRAFARIVQGTDIFSPAAEFINKNINCFINSGNIG